MAQVLCQLPEIKDDRLMVGVSTSDDGAVYKLNDDTAIIQTIDFFTPVVDDPYIFGQIAAANALSDIYAMGGQPKLAMNIICFPNCLSTDVMTKILKGGHDKVTEAGAIIVGGHTVEDDEPKYGLTVTGFANPNDILKNSSAKKGDYLILTKPLGLGIINTGIKADMVSNDTYKNAIETMILLNKYAMEATKGVEVNSCTDVTGFGLLGHGLEMAQGSSVTLEFDHKEIPIIEEAISLANMGLVPGGAYSNKKYIGDNVMFSDDISETYRDIMFDPQTSGGLLLSVNESNLEDLKQNFKKHEIKYWTIGRVLEKGDYPILVV